MITIPTVFVLGAGASQPYNFPTAWELTRSICDKILEDPQYKEWLEQATGIPLAHYVAMATALRNSQLPSVDLWLENRPEFVESGKICIAREIMDREHPSYLNRGEWYADLWSSYLFSDRQRGADGIAQNLVSFITFNYDRSLEQALMTMLRDTYGLAEGPGASILNKFKIIHVYGQVGRLPWQETGVSPEVREYQPPVKQQAWAEAKKQAKGITIVSESRADLNKFEEAKGLLLTAKRIYFLGFGYHKENLSRLNPGQPLPKQIKGSSYMLDERIRQHITLPESVFGTGIPIDRGHEGRKVLQFLKEEVPRS